jgi:MFS family permease
MSCPVAPAHGRGTAVGVAIVSLCLVQFVDVLGVTVVVTALPSMLTDVGAPASIGSLIATGYAMFFGGLLLLGSRLGDRLGHRRTIVGSLAVFAAGAALTASASSVAPVAIGRCLQGAAAAGSVPSALRLLTTLTTDGAQRQRAIAAWSAAGAAAGASGFVIGGLVTYLTTWRFVFWAYLPLAAALAVGILRSVPSDQDTDRHQSLNLAGAATFTASVMSLVVGTTLVAEPGQQVDGAVVLMMAAALGGAFVWLDKRSSAPLLPADLLRSPRLRQGTLGSALNTATTSSAVTLVTLYLQNTLGRSALEAAATLLPFSIAVIVGSSLSAALLRQHGPQQVVALGLVLISAADFSLIPSATSSWLVGVCAAVGGAGIGLSSVAATGLGTMVATHWRGSASGIINTAAQLGTATGISGVLLVAAATTGLPTTTTAPPWVAWAVAGLVAAAGAVMFWQWAPRSRPGQRRGGPGDAGGGRWCGQPESHSASGWSASG